MKAMKRNRKNTCPQKSVSTIAGKALPTLDLTPASKGKNLPAMPKIIAKEKFDIGPAKATFNCPYFWSMKLYGLIGTGFAQPTKKCEFINNRNKGTKKEPTISRCLIGFSVSLPAYLAVGSPKA